MLYRILVDLDRCRRGVLDPLTGVKAEDIARLIGAGCIAPVSAPPLCVLDGWEKRAARLAKHGIADAAQLLEADTAGLARVLRVKAAEIERWKAEIRGWLLPGEEQK